jgi:oligoendopeptidase F
VKALSAGGSVSPLQISKIVGLDVAAPEFWSSSLKVFKHFNSELEKIT